jgi:hypothetical protein
MHAQTFNSDSNWPADLVLDRGKGNWQEWDRRLHIIADQRGFRAYLDGSLPCPDSSIHPAAAYSWTVSDVALRAFILEHISDHDYDIASVHPDSHGVYKTLRDSHKDSHQNQGPAIAKMKVLKEALSARFIPNTPLSSRTFDQTTKPHGRIIKMGSLTNKELLRMLVLNALGDHYPRLQTSVNYLLMTPSNTSADIRTRLLQEEQVIDPSSESIALAAVTSKTSRPACSNCKRPGHRVEYYISRGGQMAGKSIDEARAAQEAARNDGRLACLYPSHALICPTAL